MDLSLDRSRKRFLWVAVKYILNLERNKYREGKLINNDLIEEHNREGIDHTNEN